MDGWMTCDCMSFLTVFQSYQDDGRLIMKVCVQWEKFGKEMYRTYPFHDMADMTVSKELFLD